MSEQEEWARCLCGSLRFQFSERAPKDCAVCAQCHTVWGINNNGELEICQSPFDDEHKKEIISTLDGVNRAYKSSTKRQSLIDMILEQ